MSTYIIHFTAVASASVEVEAEYYAEAAEKAHEELPRDVCAQCGGWGQKWGIDLGGDWEETGDYSVDGEYIEAES